MREFPKYYKTDNPDTLIVEFKDRRVNEKTGKEEYLVRRKTVDGEDLGVAWEEKDELMQDAVGPVYAERGGLFGVLHDTYGKSTYDRIRVKTSYDHSTDRLNLLEKRAKKQLVGAISYDKGYPEPVTQVYADEDANGFDSADEASEEDNDVTDSERREVIKGGRASSKNGQRARSKTPMGRKKNA